MLDGKMGKRKLKVCLVCSTGGHIKQLLMLRSAYEKYDHFYVLFYKEAIKNFIKENKVYLVTSPERSPLLFLVNVLQELWVYLKERPQVVISTGAGVAVAICYIVKLFGGKVIFIEDWCIVSQRSLSGRIIYPISDLFIIQREYLKKLYPKAVYGGEII